MTDQSNRVIASYYRCIDQEGFVDTFYDLFLCKSPEIAEKFANTDFKIQKLMLRQSMLQMICFDSGIAGAREEIDRLGRRHKELGITPGMYALWLDALCEAIAKHDPEYTPEIERVWRQSMRNSIDAMLRSGASADPGS